MQPDEIKRLIEAGIPDCEAFVEGDGAHFLACVVSPVFAGKSRIQKQQLVNETVKTELLNGTLHALSIKTFTPEEWDQLDTENTEK